MILNVPTDYTGAILDSDGVEYSPNKNGTVTIPDAKVPDNLWGFGFTVAQPVKPSKATDALTN